MDAELRAFLRLQQWRADHVVERFLDTYFRHHPELREYVAAVWGMPAAYFEWQRRGMGLSRPDPGAFRIFVEELNEEGFDLFQIVIVVEVTCDVVDLPETFPSITIFHDPAHFYGRDGFVLPIAAPVYYRTKKQ